MCGDGLVTVLAKKSGTEAAQGVSGRLVMAQRQHSVPDLHSYLFQTVAGRY